MKVCSTQQLSSEGKPLHPTILHAPGGCVFSAHVIEVIIYAVLLGLLMIGWTASFLFLEMRSIRNREKRD